jgi:HPt (histidine-containing phosphotransfer) domain-containing protein
MREMFIKNNFNDFLSKPIDVSKLDEMLNRWIPKSKMEKGIDSTDRGSIYDVPSIPGVDTVKGIAMTGGTAAAYRKVLSQFYKDAQDRLPLLQKTQNADTLPVFITNVHSLKSASASIGTEEISIKAAELEAAGKTADMAFINEHLPAFTQQLVELIQNIKEVLDQKESENITDPSSFVDCSSLFNELADALKKQNSADIDRIITALGEEQLDSKTKTALEKISDEVLMTEFDNALEIINSLITAQSK